MDFQAAKDYILKRLHRDLPGNLFYHGVHHTLDVCQAVDEIAEGENIKDDNLIMLRTAAAYHDIGFLLEYKNNEEIAARIAGETLGSFNYTILQISTIKKIILSTCIPQKPQTHLEKIMCDADLDYLGRNDFFEIAETLKKEWVAHGLLISETEWNKKQIDFLEQHKYFTKTACMNRESQKQKHLTLLKNIRCK